MTATQSANWSNYDSSTFIKFHTASKITSIDTKINSTNKVLNLGYPYLCLKSVLALIKIKNVDIAIKPPDLTFVTTSR